MLLFFDIKKVKIKQKVDIPKVLNKMVEHFRTAKVVDEGCKCYNKEGIEGIMAH